MKKLTAAQQAAREDAEFLRKLDAQTRRNLKLVAFIDSEQALVERAKLSTRNLQFIESAKPSFTIEPKPAKPAPKKRAPRAKKSS